MPEFFGGLEFQVFNGGLAQPVSNAEVRLYDLDGQLLETLYTNSNGETEIIELPAPNELYSTEGEGGQPYSAYNAEISADGIGELRIEGIQVFPDVISIQTADLLNGEAELIVISSPSLWGSEPDKIPEEEVKDLPDDEGFVVLDRVVIPDFEFRQICKSIIRCYIFLKPLIKPLTENL